MRGKSLKLDPIEFKKVRTILRFFDTTLSAMKIYPPQNPAIRRNLDLFYQKMDEFLKEYDELRVGVREFHFTLKGEVIFQDEIKKKSLPFLLFKDGMRELSFYKGLEKTELREFVVTLKETSDLPLEESDVVSFLWEKDFVNVRYFALDEFLDLDIGKEERDLKYDLDIRKLKEGKIKLRDEDKEEIRHRDDVYYIPSGQDKGEEDELIPDIWMSPSKIPYIKEVNIPEIESLVLRNRQIDTFDEMITLLLEILYSEENPHIFSAITDVLNQSFQEIVSHSDFSLAVLILDRVKELREVITSKSEKLVKLLEDVLKKAKSRDSIEFLRKQYLGGKIKDMDSFTEFLNVLGPEALPVISTVWMMAEDPVDRRKASDFLKEIGKKHVSDLLYLAKESDVPLTREIISLLGNLGEEKGCLLEDFVQHPNKEIRIHVIETLEKAQNEKANKILTKFLFDKDEKVRALAAESLKYLGDMGSIDTLIELVKNKDFKTRHRGEKTAIFNFLASSQIDEVYELIRSIMKKWSFFSPKQNETKLCAVAALAAAGTPEAVEILKEGTKVLSRSIRRASRLQLRELGLRIDSA